MTLSPILTDHTTLRIPAGVHYITEPILVRGRHVRITGEEGAVLRGSIRLASEEFSEAEPGVWTAA